MGSPVNRGSRETKPQNCSAALCQPGPSRHGKEDEGTQKQERKAARAARWSGQEVASEEDSGSQWHEVVAALLQLQGLETAANHGGAS